MANSLEDEAEIEELIDTVIEDDTPGDLRDEDILFLRRFGIDLLVVASAADPRGPRGPYNQTEKCHEFFNKALSWPERDFRHEFRVNRQTFDCLVGLLERNPLLISTGRKPQLPVRYHLGCFLMRYGQLGGDSRTVFHSMGIGAGTVHLYCRRVTRALRELGLNVIIWGNDAAHAQSKEHFGVNGFDQCIGIVDGSLIRLTSMPMLNGVSYLCRKKYPAINIQAVVNHLKKFISYEAGWPGSVPDVKVWKRSHIWMHRHQLFDDGEYLLADKGYPSSPFILRPFTEPEVQRTAGLEKARRRNFNRNLSNKRIYVEHAFGMLKGRFPALKALATPKDINDAYRVVHALMVLHNICIDLHDEPEQIHGCDPRDLEIDYGMVEDEEAAQDDVEAEIPDGETNIALREAGLVFRQDMLDRLFP